MTGKKGRRHHLEYDTSPVELFLSNVSHAICIAYMIKKLSRNVESKHLDNKNQENRSNVTYRNLYQESGLNS